MLKKLVMLLWVFCFLVCHIDSAFSKSTLNDGEEIELGKKVAIHVEQRWDRITDPVKITRLNIILRRLIPCLKRDLPYEIRLIREDSPNAFSLPGGIIYITTGMIHFTHSDSEIAAILAHELIHADRKHVMIQIARNQKISLVALAVMVASKGQTLPMVLANIAQITITNSFSRDLEKEADIEGINLLAVTGFHPSSMVTVMEGLSEEELKHPYVDPGIYLDHPEISERISYQIDHIRQQCWPLERKWPLNVLRSRIISDKDHTSLFVDSTEILRGSVDMKSQPSLNDISLKLEKNLQLEMAPYDIQIIKISEFQRALRVGNSIVLTESPGNDVLDLNQIRDKLILALQNAQSIHPTVDLMK